MPRRVVLLMVVYFAGCSSTTHQVIRLDTGQGAPLVYLPHRDVAPVEVSDRDFKKALAQHARTVRPAHRPLEFARQMFGVPERSGWYRYEREGRRLFPLGAENELKLELSPVDVRLNHLYVEWCGRAWGPPPRDCLHLLVDSPFLSGDGKYALAMAIAQGGLLEEMKQALGEMVSPEAVVATITGAATMYLMLWLLPEPVSKGVAALMTVGMVAYLGWDLVWRLIEGWRVMVAEVDRATTFEEIRAAGEKFRKVMGEKGTKALVMLATLAVGNTAAGMASKMPTLPGAGSAAVLAEAQMNIRYSAAALAEVESVALTPGAVVVALAPNAVAMMARGNSSAGAQPPPEGPGEWVLADEYMSGHSRRYQAQVTGAPEGYAYRVRSGDKEVDFDGFDKGVLLEAKGTGYAKFIDDKLDFVEFFKGRDKMLEQAQRQAEVARGTPIRWIVAEAKLAPALRKLFQEEQLAIEVIHISPAR